MRAYEERTSGERVKVAIVGSGNIGTDLMIKIMKQPEGTSNMELAMFAGIDPDSEGLKKARKEYGVETTSEGIGPILQDDEIKIVFDATSAKAHVRHAKMLREAGKVAIDMTPRRADRTSSRSSTWRSTSKRTTST